MGKDDKSYYFKFDAGDGMGERFKEYVGDQEDINTLYEMVREALGDTVHLKDKMAEEQELRDRELNAARNHLDRLKRQMNTVQALVRDATPAGPSTSAAQAVPAAPNPNDAVVMMTRRIANTSQKRVQSPPLVRQQPIEEASDQLADSHRSIEEVAGSF